MLHALGGIGSNIGYCLRLIIAGRLPTSVGMITEGSSVWDWPRIVTSGQRACGG